MHPNAEYLRRIQPLLERFVDFVEVSPELLWGPRMVGPRRFFRDVQQRSGLPFVAHGLGFSLGSQGAAHQGEWLKNIARDHDEFAFEWYSEHLGFVEANGVQATLPLPLPTTHEAAQVVAQNLRRLSEIVPAVAFENWAAFFSLGDPARDPAFFHEICAASGGHLMLDLHNVYTHCLNTGADPERYLDALDMNDVIAIHLSGGSTSKPAWTASGATFRLDSHDGPVPEWVWSALERTVPRCPNLRGVVLERIPESLGDADVPELLAEFERLRGVLC